MGLDDEDERLPPKPILLEEEIEYLNIFWILASSRPQVGWPIPISEMYSYCKLTRIKSKRRRLTLVRMIQAADSAFINSTKEKNDNGR